MGLKIILDLFGNLADIKIMNDIEFERVKNTKREMWWVATRGGNQVGLITKYRDTREEQHPYKVFIGSPKDAKVISFDYVSLGHAQRALAEEIERRDWRRFRDTPAGKAFIAARDRLVNGGASLYSPESVRGDTKLF